MRIVHWQRPVVEAQKELHKRIGKVAWRWMHLRLIGQCPGFMGMVTTEALPFDQPWVDMINDYVVRSANDAMGKYTGLIAGRPGE